MKMDMDKIYRALAMHATLTSAALSDAPHDKRLETFETLISSYGNGKIDKSFFLGINEDEQAGSQVHAASGA